MRALIVQHGSNRGALAAARALDQAGWTVDVAGSGLGLTEGSRSVRRRDEIRFPEGGAEALVETVRDVIREAGTEVVFPVDETQLLALSRHREELGAVLPYPEHEVVERATDRLGLAMVAEVAGLAPPATARAPVTDISHRHGFVVVKAQRPALLPTEEGWGRVETRVGTPRVAAGWLAELKRMGTGAVIQDVLQGDLASMTVLTDTQGELIAQVQQATSHTWPPDAGTSSRACTVPVDPELSRLVVGFLKALGWHGFAQLQFLVGDDGVPHFIDFNPRFYGSLSLAIGAGVNFPAIWAASATGRPLPPVGDARVGVRYQWLGGDLRRAVRSREGGLIPDVRETLGWGRSAVRPIWSLRDPGPAVRAAATFMRRRV